VKITPVVIMVMGVTTTVVVTMIRAAITAFVVFRTGPEERRGNTAGQQDETERKANYQTCNLFHFASFANNNKFPGSASIPMIRPEVPRGFHLTTRQRHQG
jgi:hypothetical protein